MSAYDELAAIVRPTEPNAWPRLMDHLGDNPSMVAMATVAYEMGYKDGGNSAIADLHEDNPDAVKLAYELVGATLREAGRIAADA